MNEKPLDIAVGSQYLINGRVMEVIYVDEELVTLRDLERLYTLSMTVSALVKDLVHRNIVQFARPPGAGSKALAFLNPEDPQVIAAKRKHYYVDSALKQLGGSLPEQATKALILKLKNEINDPSPPSYNSLYKWSKRYREHNCDRFCLLKEHSSAPRGKRLDPEVEAIIQEMIEMWYFRAPPAKVKSIHSYVCGQIAVINRRREGYSTLLLKKPALSTVQRKIARLCQLSADSARHGSEYVKKHHHSSKLGAEPDEILDLAEIDTHQLDINVIDKEGNLLGHIVYWTVILEIKTRCVIGWELSATYPCAEKTIRALNKALQAVIGEERRRGKPRALHSDNGSEFINIVIHEFLDRLNIIHTRGPPYAPNARARLERFFETFELWLHEQAGTTMSNPSDCEYYNSEREAAYTIESLNRHVEYWLENVYHQRKHRALNMPPAIAWERGMKNRLPPEKFSEEDLNILCRRVQYANITAAGRVQFLCLSWYGPGLQEIRSKLKSGQKAICYYNPLDLGEIWIAHPDRPRERERAYATQPEYQNNLTLSEHQTLHAKYLAEGRTFDDSNPDAALLELRQQMAEEYRDTRRLRNKARKQNVSKPKDPTANNQTDISETDNAQHNIEDIPNFEVEKL